MNYRSEIDGLRALAVVPVILFHAGISLFSGGFVGVDIFYVISGFLITTILINDLENGKFSIANFYERRVRRILPALFVVMFVCILIAWMWMIPHHMKPFSQSVLAVSFFASNILFWRESGYFEPSAEEKPLLHTWSLAVEEQYYVVFPIFLFLMWRFGKNRIFWMIVILAAISLLFSEWGWRHKPVANFYLAPTRAWEIFAGSLSAFIVNKHGVRSNNPLSILGLCAITISIFVYDRHTPFPSVYTLLPVIGVVLLILFAGKETLAAKILSTKLFVGIGLISYSAYLWHQPIFAFARLKNSGSDHVILFIALSLLSLLFGYLSWRFIERPFRNLKFMTRRQVFSISILLTIFFASFGYFGYKNGGFPNRLNEAELKYLDYFENSSPEWRYFERENIVALYRDECNFYDSPANRYGANTIAPREIDPSCTTIKSEDSKLLFLWGDSYAMSLNFGFSQHLSKEWEVLQVASSGCAPDFVDQDSDTNYCQRSNFFAFNTIKKIRPDVVVLKYNTAQNKDRNHFSLKDISERLLKEGVKHVVVAGPTPHWNPHLPENLLRFWPSLPSRTYAGVQEKFIELDAQLKELIDPIENVTYVSITDILCDEEGCLTTINGNHTNGIVQFDDGHLTPKASDFVIGEMLKDPSFTLFK